MTHPGAHRDPGRAEAMATVASCLAATGLALYLSLRLESPAVWLVLPLVLLWLRSLSPADYGLELRVSPPGPRTHLALGGSLLVLYTLGHLLGAQIVQGRTLHLAWPANPLPELAREFLLIGLPEEFFFRGYLQTELDRALGRRWRVLGAELGPGFLVQAMAFGLCHLATGDWTRLRVVFFGLLAGWLRARSGSVIAPAAYHAVANVWDRALVSSLR